MQMPDLSFIDGLLGLVLDTVYNFLVALISWMDIDPFPEMIADMPVAEGVGQFGALVSWMFPISDFVTIFNVWLGMMLFAWFCMFVWRLIKWVE